MLLIKNGNLHIGDGTVMKNSDILVKDKTILKIGRNLSSQNTKIIDADDMEVFPGFIDPACCIGALGIPTLYGDNCEKSDPIVPHMNIRYSVDPDELSRQEFYKSGITTVGLAPNNTCVMGGQIAVFKTAPMKYAQRFVKEKVALKCSVTFATKEYFGEKGNMPMTRMGIFYLLQKYIKETRFADKVKLDDKQTVINKVLEGKLPILCSAETTAEILSTLEVFKGIPVTVLDGYCFHYALEEMKESKADLVLGVLTSSAQISKHNMHLEKIDELVKNGNRIAFTTTSCGVSQGREVMIWNAIDVYKSYKNAEEIVKMMTLNPAEILGIDDKVGSLTEGKDADIVLFTHHPVKTYLARVKKAIINGEVVYSE